MNEKECWLFEGSKNDRGELFKFGTIVLFVGNESPTLKSKFLKSRKITVKGLIGSAGIMVNPCTHMVSESLVGYQVDLKSRGTSVFSVKNLNDLKPIGRVTKKAYLKYF